MLESESFGSLPDRVEVPISLDENGFVGRECPAPGCEGYFKIKPGTGLTGPDLQCHCPYCGHTGDPNTFWTRDQIEYAKSVALRQLSDVVFKELKRFEFKQPARGSFGIGISMTVNRGQPIPIRNYREQRLETDVVCEECTLHYSVFGLFAFCPDCHVHNSLQVLQRNLALVRKQIELAEALDTESGELTRHLIEDALENCVSAFDGFGRESCRVRAETTSDPVRAGAVSFQNLERAAERVSDYFGVDWKGRVEPADWDLARRAFLKRHLIAHRLGIVDQQYQELSQDPTAVTGRRVQVSASEVAKLTEVIDRVGRHLINALPRA